MDLHLPAEHEQCKLQELGFSNLQALSRDHNERTANIVSVYYLLEES